MSYVGDFTAAAAELDEEPDTFGFHGGTYRIARTVGLMPLMQFAAIAKTGVSAQSMDGMAAMYALLRDCIDPQDWAGFEAAAVESRLDAEGYFLLIKSLMAVITGRPTPRSSGSPDGPSTTGESSKGASSSPVPDGFTPVDDLVAAHR